MDRDGGPSNGERYRENRMRTWRSTLVLLFLGLVAVAAVAGASLAAGALDGIGTDIRGDATGRCVVSLHGKGGDGRGPRALSGITHLAPAGNGDGDGWGPHHWEYADPTAYSAALKKVTEAIDDKSCGQVVLTGFSNGGAMAAKIYCSGESLGGRMVGVIIDDPVPDRTVDDCAPFGGIPVRLIQSEDMAARTGDGIPCPDDWTCQGDVVAPGAYRDRLGVVDPLSTRSHTQSDSRYRDLYDGWWRD